MAGTTSKQRKLKRQEVARLRDRLVTRIKPENLEDQACVSVLAEPVCVDLPLGELLNPEMRELLTIWLLAGCTFRPGKITPQHQFCAQGLEGLVRIEPVPLQMALWAVSKTGIYRIAIFVSRGWTSDFLQDTSRLQVNGGSEPDRTFFEVDE